MTRFFAKAWHLVLTKPGLIVVGALVVSAGLAAVIWLPPLFAHLETVPVSKLPRIWYARVDVYRLTVVQVLGGIVVAFGLGVALHRSLAAMRSAAAAEDGNTIERFVQAINHLGALNPGDHTSHVVVRLGGIYSLEQIAKEAPKNYHWQVMEILTAYIRESAPIGEERERPRADVQAAFAVLGRRNAKWDPDMAAMDLRRVNLHGIDLFYFGNLDRAILEESNLSGASLTLSRFNSAHLSKAKLDGAGFGGAGFFSAVMMGASMERANLISADLRSARLEGANLSGAILQGANFEGTQLYEANLCGALLKDAKNLSREMLFTSRFDQTTVFPDESRGHTSKEIEAWTPEECQRAGLHVENVDAE